MGALQKKRMADKGLIIADCHHIITVTPALSIYTLQTKQLFTYKPDDRAGKISFASYKNG